MANDLSLQAIKSGAVTYNVLKRLIINVLSTICQCNQKGFIKRCQKSDLTADRNLTITLCKSNTFTHLVNNKSPGEAGSLTPLLGAKFQACATCE